MQTRVPQHRVRPLNAAAPAGERPWIVYWMAAQRRLRWNFALEYAVDLARDMQKPLLVVETLPCDDPWQNDRHHRFVLQGMADHAAAMRNGKALYRSYVEPEPGRQAALLQRLAGIAAAVVVDDYPMRQVQARIQALADATDVPVMAVDSNGLLPLRAAERVYLRAVDFRRFLQKALLPHLDEMPKANPLASVKIPPPEALPQAVLEHWPEVSPELLAGDQDALAGLPIDHDVARGAQAGGTEAAEKTLAHFLRHNLARYADRRSDIDDSAASGLSPYLHHGHVAAHEIFDRIARREDWSPERTAEKTAGQREGWWGMSAGAEAFLDELITWRELGYNMNGRRDDYDRYEALPDWARGTLAEHAADSRPRVYSLETFETADTHDPLWNAAQRQLVREGRLQNYLRMLWGKKILHWSASPQEALEVMIRLNDRYAVDGRDPNSYSGICWVLGRYDRPWGPERPVFGKIRYMSSRNTARKFSVDNFIKRHGPEADGSR
jgi:deoxyribodipyrimidine photo-lyase